MKINIPDEVKFHVKLCIDNIKFLMVKILENVPKDHFKQIKDVFKIKLKKCLFTILNWYRSYLQSISDGLLMIIEQEMKVNRLKNNENTRIQNLNHDIQEELYHFMNRVYNLYPKR